MFGRQFGFHSRGRSLIYLVLEHSEGSILGRASRGSRTTTSSSGINLLHKLPRTLLLEENWGAIKANSNHGIFGGEEEILEGKFSVFHDIYSGLSTANIGNTNSGILASEGELIAGRRPLDGLYPTSAVVHLYQRITTKGDIAKGSRGHLLNDSLDVSTKDSALEIGRGSSQ
jgi:hypothetical protein